MKDIKKIKRPETRPTIVDIAREANVSATTVSRSLRGDPRISSETVEKVIRIAKKLNYRPNIMARALATRGSSLIGLVLRHIEGSFFSDIIAGIQEELESKGYSIILCNSDMNHNDERNHLSILLDKQVEGIIITPISTEGINRKAYNDIIKQKVPFVVIGNPKNDVDAPYIKVDNILGGYLVGKHLIELNHKCVVYISPNKTELFTHKKSRYSENLERYEGIHQIFREHSLIKNLHVIEAPNEAVTKEIVEEILSLKPLPTAIFTYGDMMAIKSMRLLEKKGYQIPRDFSIVGYDDLDIAALVNPSLTTIAQPKKDLGRIAALKMLGLIEGRSTTETVIKPELIVRRSTLPPP